MTPRLHPVRAAALAALCAGALAAGCAKAESPAPAATAASAGAGAAAVDVAPDKVAHDFYAWYLGELAGDRDPITLKAPLLRQYVAPALLAEIDKKMHSADGMEADYFLKTQDYLEEWVGHVSVAGPKTSGASATTLVTLGPDAAGKGEVWKLRVTLAKDGAAWKIRAVAKP